ncbi:TPA: DMT family transporter [Candidatus Micrarchaeota archaeon]|nr:DMT family transporter [Candidatus Micrarchaeota archaeon]
MNLNPSILAALGAMLFWGVGDFFIQRSTRKIGSLESLFFVGLVGAIGLFPFVAGDLNLLFSPANLLLLSFLGVLVFFVSIANFEAFRLGKLSVVDVILELELPVTVFLGVVLLGEQLSLAQFALISLVFFGIILIASRKGISLLKRFEKGAAIALATAFGMGFVNFLTASALRQTTPVLAIWVPWVFLTLISLFFIIKKNAAGALWKTMLRQRKLILAEGIFDTAAWVLFAFALVNSPLSITTAISEGYPAVAVLLGVFFNREKLFSRQYLGIILTIAASFALALL